ncbi:hypothetical protein HNR42_000788 [Deinobacterium chartae]|uniref:BNR repeat-containing family member n=1 Tax=Deinobacterium chartae TaxID=521158 RepID=A0A841HXJ7_9DEIO|nr:hypothetical protein [Deinobacterium chartae]MBB6097374.1 hypothetical protein [Deinobacterium chartae]
MPHVRRSPVWLSALLGVALAGGAQPPFPAAPHLGEPLNREPGRSVLEARLAVAPDGTVVVAWIEDTRSPGDEQGQGVFVSRWDGRRWNALGGNLNYNPRRSSTSLDLALDERGRPVLAWNENFAHVDLAVFRAWDGRRWTDWREREIGQDLTYAARSRGLAARAGEAVLAWGDLRRGGTGTELRVRRWQDRTWQRSEPFNAAQGEYAFEPQIALAASGQPVVAYLEGNVAASDVRVKRWNGSRWVALGGPLNVRPQTYTLDPQLRLDRQGRPVVAWIEDAGGVDSLFVKRWTARGWKTLGGRLNGQRPAEAPALALLPTGEPVVGWNETAGETSRVLVRRWTAQGWKPLPLGPQGKSARGISLGADRRGNVYAAWLEAQGGVARLRVARVPAR